MTGEAVRRSTHCVSFSNEIAEKVEIKLYSLRLVGMWYLDQSDDLNYVVSVIRKKPSKNYLELCQSANEVGLCCVSICNNVPICNNLLQIGTLLQIGAQQGSDSGISLPQNWACWTRGEDHVDRGSHKPLFTLRPEYLWSLHLRLISSHCSR